MTFVGAGAERSATALNFFRKDIDPLFSQLFGRYEEEEQWIKDLFRIGPADGAYMIAQCWMSAPLPGPMLVGQAKRYRGFGELTYQIKVLDYDTPVVSMRIHDMQDDKSPIAAKTQIQNTAKRLAAYRRLILPELLTATASTFLPAEVSFTNIFGGTGLFATNHSYNGQTLSNSNTGTGTAAGNVADDIWAVRKAFRDMVDSEGRPYHSAEDEEDQRMLIVIPSAMEQVYANVFKSDLVIQTAATAGSSNYTKTAFGDRCMVKVLPTLTDTNDAFFFRVDKDVNERPFVHGVGPGPRMVHMNEQNSDWARREVAEGWYWVRRDAYGVGNPFCALRVTQ